MNLPLTEEHELRVELPPDTPPGRVILTLVPSPASPPEDGRKLSPQDRAAKLEALLQTWMDEDSEEQKKEGDELLRALDEDRLSDRKLFPPELEGAAHDPGNETSRSLLG